MNAPLRFNEALLIANHAFKPFQCVAWAPQDGNGELNLADVTPIALSLPPLT